MCPFFRRATSSPLSELPQQPPSSLSPETSPHSYIARTWGIRVLVLAVSGGISGLAIAAVSASLPHLGSAQQSNGDTEVTDLIEAVDAEGVDNQGIGESSTDDQDSRAWAIAFQWPFFPQTSPDHSHSPTSPSNPPTSTSPSQSPPSSTPLSPTASSLAATQAVPLNSDNASLLPLRLQDVVILALENNREIKNAYLDRIIDREDLAVAEDQFNPDVTPRIEIGVDRNDLGLSTSTGGDVELSTQMEVQFPTGTRLEAGWTGASALQNTRGLSRDSTDFSNQQVSVQLTHPLWRNAGSDVVRAPLRIARIQEEQNIFGLQDTLIITVTNAILAYNNLILAQQQLDIQEDVLTRTEAELTRTDALIAAGRLARIERIQAEADVANRQVDLEAATNSLADAQLALVQALDIDQTRVPQAIELDGVPAATIQFSQNDEELVAYALENNPSYRANLLDLDVTALNLLQAEDAMQWDLDLVLRYNNNLDSRSAETSDVRAGIQLSRELGDRSLKQRVIQQRTQLEQLENTLEENQENLEIEVRNALRDVDFQLTQVEQAERATELAQQQLEINQTQFRRGEVTFLDVVQSQDNFVNAQNRELEARINYQNALVALDQQLGHTLETWNISIRSIDRDD